MRKSVLIGAVAAAMTFAVPAMAAPMANTVLVHGFDDYAAKLVFAVETLEGDDGEAGCSLEDYASSTGDAATGAEEEADDATECVLTAIDLDPELSNHGQVVSAFVHALRAMGLHSGGCLVREIARSGYGKDAGTEDAEDAGTEDGEDAGLEGAIDEGTSGDADLTEVPTTCGRPDSGKPEDTGRPDHAGKPDTGKPAGKPDHAGKPEGTGRPDHAGNGGNNGNGNGR